MSLTAGSIYLSSYNNGDYDTTNNFTVTLSVPVIKAKRLRVLSANFPNLLMPFGTDDNTFRIFSATSTGIGGTEFTITFATNIRWNTMSDFITYFNGRLAVASPSAAPFTASYDSSGNKIRITHNTANTSMFIPKWTYTNANFRLGYTSVTGIGATASGGAFAVLNADGFPNVFLRCNSIYVTSNISVDSNNDSNIGNIIARIPITGNYGELVNYENVHSEFSAPIFTERIKDISIQLLDENYQPLQLPNNAYFTIVLGVEY
jgi:hypothetical protein